MLAQPAFTKKDPGSYAEIGSRLQKIIADPKVQRLQEVTVSRLPDERPEEWRRVLDDISGTHGIRVDETDEAAVKIGWREYCEA
ncbi:DUF1654 domain-containing protein [Pseudomonas baltica]|uniref:DUF1654 domain-containing protein n=1 Tax=Pseudomonas baltica TaxID=2762576 RepID=UPI00289D0BBA|nr:DUF1654 domain-containing protein [Pseudomonas baltica]